MSFKAEQYGAHDHHEAPRSRSSVDTGNVWLILIRAHDHVWRDRAAAQLLFELSILAVTDFTPEERELILPKEY